jgi:hypothetical protein
VKPAPPTIDGALVVAWTRLDGRHRATGRTRHIVNGRLIARAAGLAICRYADQVGFYLFTCDDDWNAVTDTLHDTFATARQQAEREYVGIQETWEYAG